VGTFARIFGITVMEELQGYPRQLLSTSRVLGRCAIEVHRVIGTGATFSQANGATVGLGTSNSAASSIPSDGGAVSVTTIHASAAAGTVTGGNLTIDNNSITFGTQTIGCGSNTSSTGGVTFGLLWTGSTDGAMSIATLSP
jgi:hypothetical protein